MEKLEEAFNKIWQVILVVEHKKKGKLSRLEPSDKDKREMWQFIKDTIEATIDEILVEEQPMLDMFCQQGPPTKKWLNTEGNYYKGFNQCCALQKEKAKKIKKSL